MNGSVRIGALFGIPVMIHFTFILIIPLFVWVIGTQIEATIGMLESFYAWICPITIDPSLVTAGITPYLLGTVVSLGLFLCVFIHELSHSLVARKNGIQITSITLLMFGGVAQIENPEPDPVTELPMAAIGPVTSLLIGLLCIGATYAVAFSGIDSGTAGVFVFVLGYLGLLNAILFGFNIIPAFPMDGGRVLRAWLAKRMPLERATRIASDIGKAFSVVFGIVGVLTLDFILVLIAIFIYIGASQESTQVRYAALLKDVTMGDIMTRPVSAVPPYMPLHEVVSLMYATKHLGFPVVDKGVLVGMVTVADVHAMSSIDRDAMQVRDIMSRRPVTLPPEAPVTEALRLMTVSDIGRIPVVSDGVLVGIVTRTDIFKVIELKGI
jgi:Zn-dependent protease